MKEFRMPSLGADMERGTLVAWNVKPGDVVECEIDGLGCLINTLVPDSDFGR
jgi:2-keto-4-pentenoate hydratase/2-oxohepta-3-ene-1,7-dioic acid hydratase in catechol pathway